MERLEFVREREIDIAKCKNITGKLMVAGWLILALALSLTRAHAQGGARIGLGSISFEPEREAKKFQPLAGYLNKALKPQGIDEVQVVVASTIKEMATLVKNGTVDIFIDSPFPTLAVQRLTGSRPVMSRWKKGVSEYRSLLFTRKDSGNHRLRDLEGQVIVLEYPWSTTGYFVPKMMLAKAGLILVPRTENYGRVGPGEVGYVFGWEDVNVMYWIGRGKAAAGATDNLTYAEKVDEYGDRFRIIESSDLLPRHIVSFRNGLPTVVLNRIQQILLQMEYSTAGRETLEKFEKTKKFEALTRADNEALSPLRQFLDGELGSR